MTSVLLPFELGGHTFLWADDFGAQNADRVISGAAAAGLQLVEIPLLDPDAVDCGTAATALTDSGLTATCSLGLPLDAHAPDNPVGAIAFLQRAIDVAAALGSSWLTGALYGHLGRVSGAPPSAKELTVVAEVIQAAADYAKPMGIKLGLEIINRYETHLLNTAAAALELLERIDRDDTVFAHLDTFHMNIEESDAGEAVRVLGDRLGYVHLAESHRGVIGSGIFPFDRLLGALSEIGFAGPAIIEAFINGPDDLLRTTASWNPPQLDATELVEATVQHLRSVSASIR